MLYFDHAATSWKKPPEVLSAVMRAMTEAGGNPGRSAHPLSLRAAEGIFAARETAAHLFRAPEPENVLFYPNATYALNTVLHGICPRTDGREVHVLISGMEHNAVLRPLHALRERGVVSDTFPVFSDDGTVLPDAELLGGIRARLRENTVLVCACHVSNVCGAALPAGKIGALCASRGIPFLLDASQSAGVWDIDMERDGIDYLCTAGHKALLGPQGSGMLVLGRRARIPVSLVQGGNGVQSLSPEMPDFLPEALEAGTLATPAVFGLDAGMRVLLRTGIDTVRGECFALYDRLKTMLCETRGITVYGRNIPVGTTISFNIDGMACSDTAERLAAHSVCVRSGYHCTSGPHAAFGTLGTGTVRISVGYGNRLSDADAFYRALSGVLKERV